MNRIGILGPLSDWIIIVVFVGVLLVPLGLSIVQPDQSFSDTEKRTLATVPQRVTDLKTLIEFPSQFDSYYKDHFGMREWLIHRNHREMDKRFGMDGVLSVGSVPVVKGRDGWLFFAGDNLLDDLRGQLQVSDEESQLFYQNLRAKKDWFARRNIEYIPLVAANKQSIYPEHLPRFYRRKQKETRLDALLATSDLNASQMILDLRPSLMQGKAEGRLYDKTDTHWNDLGAHSAYLHIMERVQQLYPGFTFREDFGFENAWEETEGGDLALMLGQHKSQLETRPILKNKKFTARLQRTPHAISKLLSLSQFNPEFREQKKSHLRLLVLHDSFFNRLKPFVSENFDQALYIWQFYDKQTMEVLNPKVLDQVISVFKPNLVIEEVVERRLDRLFYTVNQDWSDK